jgi:alpha-amylase
MGDDIVALPDVNTENAQVQQMLSQWIQETVLTFVEGSSNGGQVTKYSIDGLRIDAAKSIPYFFAQMVNNVTDSYAVGEVFDGDAGYACAYQQNGLDAFLNFPVYTQVPTPPPPIHSSNWF